jgi:hypothetical protein
MLRRFLVLAALMFWQGGFVFYAAVVVPVGQDELGSHTRQGFITRRVTDYLNMAGAVALVPLGWDAAANGDKSAWRRRTCWAMWLAMAGLLGALAFLHVNLESLLDTEAKVVEDALAFRPVHRLYLWLSTVQWACALIYLWCALRSWRAEDAEKSQEAVKRQEEAACVD